MCRNWLVVGVRVIVVGLVLSVLAGEGLAKGRGGGHKKKSAGSSAAYKQQAVAAIQSQLAAAQALLSQIEKDGAMSSEALDTAKKQLEDSQAAIEAADSEQDTLRKQLRDIEEELVSSQPADSEVGRARDAYAKAKEDVDNNLRRILESPGYQARLKLIADSSDAGKYKVLIRKDTLDNDQEYQTSLHTLEDARKRFNQLKTELFAKDSDWQATTKALSESEATEKEARKLRGGKGVSPGKTRQMRNSQQVAAAARATIAQAEAKLRALGVNPDGKK